METNLFSIPRQSIATHFKPPRILKSVGRNPRYHGYYIESGAKALESTLKTQRIRKVSI
ncbi:hypothetical protein ABIE32_002234 [Comamonas sp. 4034]